VNYDKQAIAEMETVKLSNGLTDDDVAVRGTSHIGGHKLAGVCIGTLYTYYTYITRTYTVRHCFRAWFAVCM
jgi:hypothetical protein